MTPLEELLQQCTVKITVPGGWGTGFFVASGLVLTCAHVVRKAADLPIAMFYAARGLSLSAIATAKADDGATLDLALLKLSEPLPDHPCVLLDEEPVEIGQELYSYGYLQSYPHAAPVCLVHEGLTGDKPPLLKLQGAQIEAGISGAALLNLRTGKVCGMVKETRAAGFDLGGGAVPTRVILEQFPELRELQQVFHESDRRWVNLIRQPGIDFQSYLQAILADDDYRDWQEIYTPTTVEDRQQISEKKPAIASQRRFSSRLKLRAEIVKPDKQEQGDHPDRVQEPQERIEQWDVLAGLRNYATEHVVLIGKPGSGKSTSLERLLWEEAEKALHDPKARIPVLVKLRRCTGTIEALIRDFLLGHQVVLEMAQVKELLRQGRFLLLLDGLNELPKDFEIEIANFRNRYRRTTPMIVSTRDLGGGGTLGIEKTLKMLPLNEPQMREFVRGYLGEEGDRLFQQLQGDRLRKFAETPLLLWMLCRVFAQNGKVPDNLGLAFREFAQLYDKELQADAPVDSKDQWRKLLRHLAFVMMQGKTAIDPQLSIPREKAEDCLTAYLQQEDRSNPRGCAERWLQDLLKYHLIQPVIQPNFEEHIEFRHQLIQEYYTAEYLLKLLPNLTDEQLQQDYLNYLKWTEAVALMLALEDEEAQALRIVQNALGVDWSLGSRLAGEVQLSFQTQTVESIKCLDMPEWLKCRYLGKTRSDAAIIHIADLFQDKSCFIREEAVKALGEIGSEKAAIALLHGLRDEEAEVVDETFMVLRQIASKALIPNLIELMDKIDDYAKGKTDRIIEDLIEKTNTLEELRFIADTADTNEAVRKYLERYDAVKKWLNKCGYLNEITDMGSESVSQSNTASETELKLEELHNLVSQLEDPSFWEVFINAEWSERENVLKRLNYKVIHRKLERSIINCCSGIHKKLLQFMKVVICFAVKAAQDSDCRVREQAVFIVEEIWTCIRNSNQKFSSQYIKEILEKVRPVLLKASKDPSKYIRVAAIRALSATGETSFATRFREALQDPEYLVRAYSALALGELADEQAIQLLLDLLNNDESQVVRAFAAEALGKMSQDKSLLVEYLPGLVGRVTQDLGKDVQNLMTTIQNRCKFYNYETWQAHLAAQKVDNSASQRSSSPSTTIYYHIDKVGNLNTGNVNINGDQIGEQNS